MSPIRVKRVFKRITARRIESERAKVREARLKTIFRIFSKTVNLILLLAGAVLVSLVWQQRIADPYLTANRAVGGDYFNALTYAKFFAEHTPFPPTGWMPFWNAGVPVVGGYPTAFFYAILPLTRIFDVPTSMELTSIILLLAFLIFSHFLFWEVARNHFFSLLATGILIVTPATYYALTAEGLITGSAMQWLLPLTFFPLIRFIKFQESHLLVATGLMTGLAFLVHPAMALITVFIPAGLYLTIADPGDPSDSSQTQQLRLWKIPFWTRIWTKVRHLLLYTLISTTVGGAGVATLILSLFFSGGSGPCTNPQCWGDYPLHLIWFSPLLLLPLAVCLPFALIAARLHRAHFSEVTAPAIALLTQLVYVGAAWLRLIDNQASAIFPRRLFWSITLFALLLAAAAYRYTSKASRKLGLTAGAGLIIGMTAFLPLLPGVLRFTLADHLKVPNTLPMNVDDYIVPKYQTLPRTDILPDWLPVDDPNWRLESIRPDFFVWWNTISQMPATRGYSNAPTREHLDWIYYLQTATLIPPDPEALPDSIRKNRATFLLDAFAVKILQQPAREIVAEGVAYDPLLLADPELVSRTEAVREWTYVELASPKIGPIVAPTAASRLLVATDEPGFATVVRALSLTPLTSQVLLPIKAPQTLAKLDDRWLAIADTLLLYRTRGDDWEKVERFVEQGGRVWIEAGSLEDLPTSLPRVFGAADLAIHKPQASWQSTPTDSPLLTGVDTKTFSPLTLEGEPWKIVAPPSAADLTPWNKPVLTLDGVPLLSQGSFGKGVVVISGFNLPYHIVNYQNPEEVKLLTNILSQLGKPAEPVAEFAVKRVSPTLILATTRGARGIYFKENFHPGWKAKVNGSPSEVAKAGVGFMYLPLDLPQSEVARIELSFRGSPGTWGLFLVSVVAAAVASLFIVTHAPFQVLRLLIKKNVARPLTSWWAREE